VSKLVASKAVVDDLQKALDELMHFDAIEIAKDQNGAYYLAFLKHAAFREVARIPLPHFLPGDTLTVSGINGRLSLPVSSA